MKYKIQGNSYTLNNGRFDKNVLLFCRLVFRNYIRYLQKKKEVN